LAEIGAKTARQRWLNRRARRQSAAGFCFRPR
jgi:hypothetical protein